MLQKLETVLKKQKCYPLEDCTIDSLMRLECDYISCEGCQYALCDKGIICGVEVKNDLYGIR